MKCLRNYSPDDFYDVLFLLEDGVDSFEAWAEENLTRADTEAILKAYRDNRFDEDFRSVVEGVSPTIGETSFNGVAETKTTLNNEDNISHISSMIANPNIGRFSFEAWTRDFVREVFNRTLFNIETSETFNPTEIMHGNIPFVSIALLRYKQKLLNEISKSTRVEYRITESDDDETITNTINKALNDFKSDPTNFTSNNSSAAKAFYLLESFDEIVEKNIDCIRMKQKYVNNKDVKGVNMYEWTGPTIKVDASWSSDENSPLNKYSSKLIKKLCEYIPEIDDSGRVIPSSSISFKGFNAAISRVVNWVNNGNTPSWVMDEIDRGLDCDWAKIIDEYKKNKKENDSLKNVLNAIQNIIFGKNKNGNYYLTQEVRDSFAYQINNSARANWIGYRLNISDNGVVLSEELLTDSFINKQNANIKRNLKSRIYYFRNIDNNKFDEILSKYNISIEENGSTKTIIFKGTPSRDGLSFDRDYKINVSYDDSRHKYEFVTDQDSVYNDVSDTFLKNLAIDLGVISNLPDNYEDFVKSIPVAGSPTLLGVLANPICVTITGAYKNSDGEYLFNNYEGKLPNLWRYSNDFNNFATFLGIIEGSDENTVVKNAEGNNLPMDQLKDTVHDSRILLRDNSLERSSLYKIKSGYGDWNRTTIFKYNDLNANKDLLGNIYTRSDILLNNTSKNTTDYNVEEVAYLSMLKDCYELLNDSKNEKGEIRLQSITHADKKTHFLVGYNTAKLSIPVRNNKGEIKKMSLKKLLLTLSGNVENSVSREEARTALYNHIRKVNADKTLAQISEMSWRFSKVLNYLSTKDPGRWNFKIPTTSDRNIIPAYGLAKNMVRQMERFISSFESVKELRNAFDAAGVYLTDDYDYIRWGDGLHMNETIVNSLELYCNNTSDGMKYFKEYNQACINYDLNTLAENGMILSTDFDSGLREVFKPFKNNPEFSSWFDPISNDMELFRVYDGNTRISVGMDNINEVLSKDIGKINNYKVVLNPIYEIYHIADMLLSTQFNDNIYGVVPGFEIKSAKKRKFDISFDDIFSTDLAKRSHARSFLKECESERSIMQAKRTVIGGATRFGFSYGRQDSVSMVTKVAVIDDINGKSGNYSGDIASEKVADGAGYANPYQAYMEGNSLKDLQVGKDKKTIFNWTDPETGVMSELKWAVFVLTNEMRRDEKVDPKFCAEEAFRKMNSFELSYEDLNKFDLSKYYDPNGNIKGDYILNDYIYKYDNESGSYYRLDSITRNNANRYTAIWRLMQNNGIATDVTINDTKSINNLYDIDQFIGGAFTAILNDDHFEWSDKNNEFISGIICKQNWKDKFIGYLVNKSAIKVGAKNVNEADTCNLSKSDLKLKYFEMLNCYGGVQMNADHELDESTVTEMSQVISSLIQRGNAFNLVDQIYNDIGRVAAEAINKITKANISDNPSEIFTIIGHALMDTFNSGNKATIGLTQTFVNRFEQLLKEKNQNEKITLPLSAETITPAFFNTVGAMLNKRGIKRKYAGFAGYQCPSYNLMRHYNVGGVNMKYTEVSNKIRPFVKSGLFRNIDEAFYDAKIISKETEEINGIQVTDYKALNPFVVKLDINSINDVKLEDTVIIVNRLTGEQKEIKIDNEDALDDIRNFTNLGIYNVFNYTIKPRELAAGVASFDVSRVFRDVETGEEKIFTERHILNDLDSVRASRYLTRISDGEVLEDNKIQIVIDQLHRLDEFKDKTDDELLSIIADNAKEIQKAVVNVLVRGDFKKLSNIRNGNNLYLENQNAFFRSVNPNIFVPVGDITISNYKKQSGEIVVGLKNARQYLLRKGDTLNSILNYEGGAQFFFLDRLKKKYRPLREVIESSEDLKYNKIIDAMAYSEDGKPIFFTKRRDDVVYTNLRRNTDYSVDPNGDIWYKNDKEIGTNNNFEFYKTEDGYDYIVVDDLKDIKNLQKTNYVDFLQFAKVNDDWEIDQDDLESRTKSYHNKLARMARQMAQSFELQLKYIGARIPAQSMQSFMDLEVINFIDSDINQVYVPRKLTWIEGSK